MTEKADQWKKDLLSLSSGDPDAGESWEDANRIARELSEFLRFEVTGVEAYLFWSHVSEKDYGAGWVILPEDDRELRRILERSVRLHLPSEGG